MEMAWGECNNVIPAVVGGNPWIPDRDSATLQAESARGVALIRG